MRTSLIKLMALIVMSPFLLLTACTVFSPVKQEQTNAYVVNSLPRPIIKKPAHRVSIIVMQPVGNQIYNTTQMAYTTRPYQVNYFAKNTWIDTPTQMLQSSLVQTLQGTHYFYAVGSPSSIGYYDYILNTQLIHFEQQFLLHYSEEVITIRAQIIKTATNRIVATKQFTVVEPAPENTPYGGVVAANRAMTKILAQVSRFCLRKVN